MGHSKPLLNLTLVTGHIVTKPFAGWLAGSANDGRGLTIHYVTSGRWIQTVDKLSHCK